MKLYRVRALFTVLVRCRSIRLCMDCLSANQIKEFAAYFNQYTLIGVIFRSALYFFLFQDQLAESGHEKTN